MDSDKVSRAPPYSGYSREMKVFRIQGYHLLWPHFPMCSTIQSFFYSHTGVLQPQMNLVWAVPLSLATTKGIDFSFSSSGYLDVSVHRVALSNTMYSC